MPEAVHVHLPEELHEGSDPPVSHRERLFELGAVLLLSVATVCIAWSGYQAAKWSGLQARRYAQASSARALANRAATLGGQERLQDLTNFNRWLELTTQPTQVNLELAELYSRRFRPEFRPAFQAWLAQAPMGDLQAAENDTSYASTRRRTRPSTPTTTSSARCSSPRCSSSPPSRCASSGCRCA